MMCLNYFIVWAISQNICLLLWEVFSAVSISSGSSALCHHIVRNRQALSCSISGLHHELRTLDGKPWEAGGTAEVWAAVKNHRLHQPVTQFGVKAQQPSMGSGKTVQKHPSPDGCKALHCFGQLRESRGAEPSPG